MIRAHVVSAVPVHVELARRTAGDTVGVGTTAAITTMAAAPIETATRAAAHREHLARCIIASAPDGDVSSGLLDTFDVVAEFACGPVI